MSLTNYYSMIGLQTEEPFGAHFIPGGLQGSSVGCAKPAREEEEGTTGSHIPDFSHFSNKQTGLNSFSSWTNTSTSSSSSSPQLQSIPGLFHPHHLLNHQHHQPHHQPYYGPQTHTEHAASSVASESRFIRCWEGVSPASEATTSHASAGFAAGVPAQGDLSEPNPRFEAVKPEHSPPSNGSPAESSFDTPTEVVLERLGSAEELGGKPEPKQEDDEGKAQLDPGKDRCTKLKNVY